MTTDIEEEQRIWREFGPAAMSKYGKCSACHMVCEIWAGGKCFDCTYLEIHHHAPFDPEVLASQIRFIRAARRVGAVHTNEYKEVMKALAPLYNCEVCYHFHGSYSLPKEQI